MRRIESPLQVIGLDGEGYTDRRGRHRYTYLAACSSTKLVSELHRPRGIASHEVFDWLLSLPKKATLVGFSLGYDLTKWVEGMRDSAVWNLMRPDEPARQSDFGPRPVKWRGYRVNKLSRRFTVSSAAGSRTVWDVWAFFQTSFVAALKKWEVTDARTIARIARMKDARAGFSRIGPRERAYCRSECRLLAKLVTSLLAAHADAGLPLAEFYGPGSTAKLMLTAMQASKHNVRDMPTAFWTAVDVAFAAGRFECSRVGPVPEARYAYDLASAYPYAWCLIPCMKHGRWQRVGASRMRRHLARGGLALVRWKLRGDGKEHAWGPLPFRIPKVHGFDRAAGNLIWPVAGGQGWAWSPEIVAGQKLHGGIHVMGGWVFQTKCRCGYPFRAHMVRWYKTRLRWGNKGKGRVLRLGLNSCTGKAMQRVGTNPNRCMVRAGLVTSFTRARLLEAIACASHPNAIVETATDSVLSTEPLKLPPPIDLGTARAAGKAGSNPLGAWDASDVAEGGTFLCRPGQRFRLEDCRPGHCLKAIGPESTASRGMPVKWLHANRERILRHWQDSPGEEIALPAPASLRIFIGAKQAIRKHRTRYTFTRDASYGTWVEPKPRKLSFAAKPKREHVCEGWRLEGWELPEGIEAAGYSKCPESEQTRKLRELEEERENQE